jgi:hypothetical protein
MTCLTLFSPGIVLAAWWLSFVLVGFDKTIMGAALALLTVAVFASELERIRIRRDLRRR